MCTVRLDIKIMFCLFRSSFFWDVASDFTCIKDDDFGTVYQDSESMAAVLVNHDAEDDALILVINLSPSISSSCALSLSDELLSLASSRYSNSFSGRFTCPRYMCSPGGARFSDWANNAALDGQFVTRKGWLREFRTMKRLARVGSGTLKFGR